MLRTVNKEGQKLIEADYTTDEDKENIRRDLDIAGQRLEKVGLQISGKWVTGMILP